VTTPGGIAELDGDQTVIEGYASYQGERSFMNLTAGYATTDWSFGGPTFGARSATVDGLIGSLQVGMRWAMDAQWRIGLMGQINYDGTTCGSNCLLAGVTENASEWQGGLAVRVDGAFPVFKPYFEVSYSDDFDGGNEVSLGGAVVAADTASSLLGARAGFDARVSDGVGLFANVGMTEGLDSDVSGYDGQAGLKVYW
jgi:outer membrane autotransporter protein